MGIIDRLLDALAEKSGRPSRKEAELVREYLAANEAVIESCGRVLVDCPEKEIFFRVAIDHARRGERMRALYEIAEKKEPDNV